jgi:hypothetical protein
VRLRSSHQAGVVGTVARCCVNVSAVKLPMMDFAAGERVEDIFFVILLVLLIVLVPDSPCCDYEHDYEQEHEFAAQPTDPSISRSISRFSSTEYSIGNWRARSLMNPLTARLIAWPSVSPRCCI